MSMGHRRVTSVVLACAAPFLSTGSIAQDAGACCQSGDAIARIVAPLKVFPIAQLHFGSLVVGAQEGGTVTVRPEGGTTIYGGSARSGCALAASCGAHPGRFRVEGEPARQYRITIAATVRARGQSRGVLLEVSQLELLSLGLGSSTGQGQLDEGGRDQFSVGGTLEVPAGTAADVFRAELPVTVAYE